MSLKKNIFYSYISQIYIALAGIIMLPLYLKYMGAEAYGLVGFFAMLQVWFNVLDVGLTPTVARETARFRGGAISVLNYRRLLRAIQIIFIIIALIGGGLMFVSAEIIAHSWLNVQNLDIRQVVYAIQIIAIIITFRWMSGLYKACILGSEKLSWLSWFSAFIATLRFVGVLPVLIWVGHSTTLFFSYQLMVAVIELIFLFSKTYKLFPILPAGQTVGWSIVAMYQTIKPKIKFSLTIAFTSLVWILVTQTDKLILSKLLPLADYGFFTMAILAASGVMLISGPISNAVLPRMSFLQAASNEEGVIRLYRNATQMVAVIAVPASLTLAFFAEHVLTVWTGDVVAAKEAAPILSLYALGNGLLTMASFPYYLQFARGELRFHLIGNLIFMLLFIPTLIWSTWQNGAIGAGYTWLLYNAISFFAWVPFVHNRLIKGLHHKWLIKDILPIFSNCLFICLILRLTLSWKHEQLSDFITLTAVSCLVLSVSAFSSNMVREKILYLFYKSVR